MTITILDTIKAFAASLEAETGPEAEQLKTDLKAAIASAEAYVPVFAAKVANATIAVAAAKFPPAAFLIPLEGPVIDPFVSGVAKNFESAILNRFPSLTVTTTIQPGGATGTGPQV